MLKQREQTSLCSLVLFPQSQFYWILCVRVCVCCGQDLLSAHTAAHVHSHTCDSWPAKVRMAGSAECDISRGPDRWPPRLTSELPFYCYRSKERSHSWAHFDEEHCLNVSDVFTSYMYALESTLALLALQVYNNYDCYVRLYSKWVLRSSTESLGGNLSGVHVHCHY